MARKRDHFRYHLKQGNKVVYVGITDNPERREQQHRDAGKMFSKLKTVGPVVKKDTAEKWEEDALKQYRSAHKGRNPRYNKTDK